MSAIKLFFAIRPAEIDRADSSTNRATSPRFFSRSGANRQSLQRDLSIIDADESSVDSSASRLLTFAKIAKSHSLPRCTSRRRTRLFSLPGYFHICSKSRKAVSVESPLACDFNRIKSRNAQCTHREQY